MLLLLLILFLMCYHGAARDIAPVVFGAVVTTLLVLFVPLSLMLSWLHCSCCWSCCLWCCQGNTARGHDARAVGSGDIGCRHGDTARAFGFSSLGYCPVVFDVVMATLLVPLVLLPLVSS